MPELLRMPQIAADAEDATLSSWLVPERQEYSASEAIATVETAKAAVDIEAEADGVIIKTLVLPGTEVRTGDVIALIGRPGETDVDIDATLVRLGVSESPAVLLTDAPDEASEPEAGTEGTPADLRTTDPTTSSAVVTPSTDRVFASPLARRVAREAGVPFEQLVGSGPNGRIVRRDVERAVSERSRPQNDASSVPRSSTSAPMPSSSAGSVPGTDVPHSKLRKLIARRLTESKTTTPHFYLRGSANVDDLLALRSELNAVSPLKISVNDLIVKAVASAHCAVPDANVIWTTDAVRHFDSVDLGIAITSESGLVTPVLRGVDQMSISDVAAATRDLVVRAKAGQLKQQELEGGSSTITNLGMFGTEEFAAIINPPQSSILAVGAARMVPIVTPKGKIKAASVLRVTLSVDHRAIDGALAAQWMKHFIQVVENPLRILI
jgi:pyruvate dehydrogenase E2 component (dihydrolipoamide acetyltransferase)